MGNDVYIIFIMWNSISGLEAWYHFWFNISCGVAVTVRGHKKNQVTLKGRGGTLSSGAKGDDTLVPNLDILKVGLKL